MFWIQQKLRCGVRLHGVEDAAESDSLVLRTNSMTLRVLQSRTPWRWGHWWVGLLDVEDELQAWCWGHCGVGLHDFEDTEESNSMMGRTLQSRTPWRWGRCDLNFNEITKKALHITEHHGVNKQNYLNVFPQWLLIPCSFLILIWYFFKLWNRVI